LNDDREKAEIARPLLVRHVGEVAQHEVGSLECGGGDGGGVCVGAGERRLLGAVAV
jgi:hypothetical protein